MMVQDNLENRPVGDYPVCTVHGWTWAYAPCQYCRAEQAEARVKELEEALQLFPTLETLTYALTESANDGLKARVIADYNSAEIRRVIALRGSAARFSAGERQ